MQVVAATAVFPRTQCDASAGATSLTDSDRASHARTSARGARAAQGRSPRQFALSSSQCTQPDRYEKQGALCAGQPHARVLGPGARLPLPMLQGGGGPEHACRCLAHTGRWRPEACSRCSRAMSSFSSPCVPSHAAALVTRADARQSKGGERASACAHEGALPHGHARARERAGAPRQGVGA